MRNVGYGIVSTIFVTMFLSVGIQNTYAEDMTYNEKLEFSMKLEQITGHMISALDNMVEKDYKLAKMHLIHPMGEHHDITQMISEESTCSKKLKVVLSNLQYINPQFDTQTIQKDLANVFQVIEECKQDIVGQERYNLTFNIELIEKLLAQSQKEYEYSQILAGKSKMMEIQDSIGLVTRSHMLIKDNNIIEFDDYRKISMKFNDLFALYDTNPTLVELMQADNLVLDEIDSSITKNVGLFGGKIVEHDTEVLNKPSLILKSTEYSNNNMLIELQGTNFDTGKKITIEYYSPNSKNHKTLNVVARDSGEFTSAIEFVQDASSEPYLFSITIGDSIFHEVLAIS